MNLRKLKGLIKNKDILITKEGDVFIIHNIEELDILNEIILDGKKMVLIKE